MVQLSPAARYFVEYWEDLWSGLSSKRDLLKSFNPRVVIQELRDEVTLNKQRNISNENFFKRTLGGYIKSDPGSTARLKIHLQMILTELNVSKHRPRYLPLLCDSALSVFTELQYFEDCLVSLIGLTTAQSLDLEQKNAIKLIVNHLIVELRSVGYTDYEIRKMPKQIFSSIQDINDSFYWDFPYQQRCGDWESPAIVKAFRTELESYQATLAETDRISALLTIAKRTAKPITFVFRVNGMVGTMSLDVAEVLFYAPSQKLLVTEPCTEGHKKAEWFWSEPGSDVVNAAVTVDAISPESGEPDARARVEKALALCRRIANGKSPLWLGKSYLALNETGSVVYGSNHTFERIEDDFTKRFNLRPEQQSGLLTRLELVERMRKVSNANGWGRRFDEASHWLRKAEESSSYVEQLLSYWICIETLCAKSDNDTANWFETKNVEQESDISLIREVVGKMVAIGKCYEHGWMIHRELTSPFAGLKGINIPPDLAKMAQLDAVEGESILLINFINCSEKLENNVPNGMLKEQICELRKFYGDKCVALDVLRRHLETAQDELAFIYRMRNKIAHDGSSDHFLLPSLCKLAAHYALSFFFRVGDYVGKGMDADLTSILIKAVQGYDRIELRLKTEDPVAVFLDGTA